MHGIQRSLALNLVLWLCILCLSSQAQEKAVGLTVQVGDKPALLLTQEDLAKMSRHKVTINEHGHESSYEGVFLHDVLEKAGAPFGNQLHGRTLSDYVLATARDGYAVIYTLTEMDSTFVDSPTILIADHQNGKPLPELQGPLRIIVPNDKKPARSIRMLERLEVVQTRK